MCYYYSTVQIFKMGLTAHRYTDLPAFPVKKMIYCCQLNLIMSKMCFFFSYKISVWVKKIDFAENS